MSLTDFKIQKKLGAGAYSSVYKVQRILDNEIYALKKVNLPALNEKEKKNALNQIRILASIRHQNIIGYRQAFFDQYSKSLCIIMEYADNGDLYQKITEKVLTNQIFPEKQVWEIFIQLCRALKNLHQNNILHRDLKSANVFLTKNGIVKIGDMNVSKVSERGLCLTQTGTPYYASPEVWKDEPYGIKSDIWSLGCVMYQMMALKPPFQAEDMEGLYKKIIKGEYQKLPLTYSSDLNDLIRILLQTDPHKRPNCQKLLNMKMISKRIDPEEEYKFQEPHPFIKTIQWQKNMDILNENLPKPNYLKFKTEENETKGLASEKMNKKPISLNMSHIFSGKVEDYNKIHNRRSLILQKNSIIRLAREELKNNKYIHNSINLLKLKEKKKRRSTDNNSTEEMVIKKSAQKQEKIEMLKKIYQIKTQIKRNEESLQ